MRRTSSNWLYITIILLVLGSVFALLLSGMMLTIQIGGYAVLNSMADAFLLGGHSEFLRYYESPGGTHLLMAEHVTGCEGQEERLAVFRIMNGDQAILYIGPWTETLEVDWLSEDTVCIHGTVYDLLADH